MSGSVFHAPFIAANPNFELVRIVERTKALSAEHYPKAIITRSVEELLNDDSIELVVVNTPDSTHYEYAREALLAGKHVIVEKPFTQTVAEGEELVRLAAVQGRMLSVYQSRRWDGDFLTVRQLIQSGRLGRLVEYESTLSRYRNYIRSGSWKETGEWGGGLVYNLGSHLIDQAIELFGIPEAVYADVTGQRTGTRVDDYFIIRLLSCREVPDVSITLKSSYLQALPEPRFVLHGTLGSYIKHGVDPQEDALKAGVLPNGAEHWGEEPEEQWGKLRISDANGQLTDSAVPTLAGNYGLFYQNIYEHLREGKRLLTDAINVLSVIRVIEAAYQSARDQAVVSV
jgi:predicted dehydrogenase